MCLRKNRKFDGSRDAQSLPAIFSLSNGMLWRPLPVKNARELVVIATKSKDIDFPISMSYPDYQDYRQLKNMVSSRIRSASGHRKSVSAQLCGSAQQRFALDSQAGNDDGPYRQRYRNRIVAGGLPRVGHRALRRQSV
jgi:hypothetical protein